MVPSNRSKPKAFRDWIPGWYITLVVLSTLIVTIFIANKLLVQPPELSAAATDMPPTNPVVSPEQPNAQDDPPEAPIAPLVRKDNLFTFLLFGVDKGGGNTDTIMVGAYDTEHQTISLVSIPRDTMIDANRSNKKINAAYAYEGVSGLESALEHMLGFPIDFYVKVNLRAFEKVVDAVGGVDFDVPPGMHYTDPTQDLYIDLEAGYQHLDGEHALQLVRCRSAYVSQDIGRMETQQAFLKALAKQTLKISNLTNIGKLASIVNENVETDLGLDNIIWFAQNLLSLDMNKLNCSTLPFSNSSYMYEGGSYLLLDPDAVLSMVNEWLNPYTTDLEAGDLNIFVGS